MYKLYYSKGTVAAAVAIALKEVGADFEGIALDFPNGEHKGDAYLAINPKARVPALVTDQGILTETLAILYYICEIFPEAGLCPEDAFETAQMHSVMTYLASTAHVNHAHKMRGARWADKESSFEDMRNKVSQTMTEVADYLETHCLKGPFLMGDQLTVADPYLFIVCNWLAADGVDVAAFPKLARFHETFAQRPATQAAKADGYF